MIEDFLRELSELSVKYKLLIEGKLCPQQPPVGLDGLYYLDGQDRARRYAGMTGKFVSPS